MLVLWGNGRENWVLHEIREVWVQLGRKFRSPEEVRLNGQFMKKFPKQTSISTLDQRFSNCGPWASSICITWDLVRNTNPMA